MISSDFIVPQLHVPRQKCVENVSFVNITERFRYNDVFSDVFPFSLYRVQELYTRYFNVFTETEKGQWSGEIFKTITFSFYTCTLFP